jgi:two-component system chemotaxis response regulator CheB
MSADRIVVIGASAGGVGALQEIARGLPPDFAAPILLVLHVAANHRSLLPDILSIAGPLRAELAVSNAPLRAGRIYVAPPDHHLLADKDRVVVSRGPKENMFRPSIDVLFRSAAYHFGARAIGVVLSGLLADGSSGLYAIRRLGGIAVIQDPDEAVHSSMPLSALRRVDIDYALPVSELAQLLAGLVKEPPRREPLDAAHYRQELKLGIDISSSDSAFERGLMDFGEASTYTCPECHGVLFRVREGKTHRFRCHTGHGFTTGALIDELKEYTEAALWQAVKSLQESSALLMEAAAQLGENGEQDAADRMRLEAREIHDRLDTLRVIALERAGMKGQLLERER